MSYYSRLSVILLENGLKSSDFPIRITINARHGLGKEHNIVTSPEKLIQYIDAKIKWKLLETKIELNMPFAGN